MAAITRRYHDINVVTGFANGDRFDTATQIRDYFTIENLWEMVGREQFIDADGRDLTPAQITLDRWAQEVIENRWHCAEDFTEDN
jgi:hypothetical protein